jgi:hypothetical protein
MKEGPQGKSSQSFLHSLKVIKNNFSNVLEIFKNFLDQSKNSNKDLLNFNLDLLELWDGPREETKSLNKSKLRDSFIGKISIVNDPEGKRRIIAMLDY